MVECVCQCMCFYIHSVKEYKRCFLLYVCKYVQFIVRVDSFSVHTHTHMHAMVVFFKSVYLISHSFVHSFISYLIAMLLALCSWVFGRLTTATATTSHRHHQRDLKLVPYTNTLWNRNGSGFPYSLYSHIV